MKNWIKNIQKRFKRNNHRSHFFRNLMMVLFGIGLLIIAVVLIWVATLKVPDFSAFEERLIVNSTKIYDRTGEVLLYNVHQDIKRTNIPFLEMGENIKNATIAIEDKEFYNHNGVRVTSTIRAVLSNVFNVGIGGGGSTITQQLIKNTLLTSKRSVIRKVKEWILAVKIENALTKDEILELYLNEVPYGGTVYGIEEAAKTYFNKKAKDLTITEAAYLAAIPQSPTRLSPFGKNLGKLDERKNLVLFQMKDMGFINEEQYQTSRNEKVEFQKQALTGIKAPHFVFYIKEYLEEKYGKDVVEKGGLKVITTLDWKLQEKAELFVKEGALKNARDWGGSNAALVAIDPKTGQILSMVGSRDYFDKDIDGNFNVATALRQPGSAFKPFIYATAFNKGFTPETVLFDLPTEFQATCDVYGKAISGSQDNCYMPNNYDGKFRGPLSLREALAQSINIPAIKLFYLAGLKDSLKTAEDFGISTLGNINNYGLTLVIGGGEVTLLDITSAYGVFANNGLKNKQTGVLEVVDRSGTVLEKYEKKEKEVFPKNPLLALSSVLSDNNARIPTFGAGSPLEVPGYQVAVKTGTTNSNKDAWTVGYTPNLAVGVWAGNNDNKPMKKGGSAVAGPIWNKFMSNALPTLPTERFEQHITPSNLKPILRGYWQGNDSYFIDSVTGNLATDFTPEETKVEKTVTNVKSILYWIDRNNILGDRPVGVENTRTYINWNTPIQNWWNSNSHKYDQVSSSEIPTQNDNLHGNYKPFINLIEPKIDKIYNSNEIINLKIETQSLYPITKIDVFMNGAFVSSLENPFQFSFIGDEVPNLKDVNELRLNVYDTIHNRTEVVSNFRIGI